MSTCGIGMKPTGYAACGLLVGLCAVVGCPRIPNPWVHVHAHLAGHEGGGRGSLPRSSSYISSWFCTFCEQIAVRYVPYVAGMAKRLEITVSDDTLGRLDELRGHEPRASFVRRALEAALGSTGDVAPSTPGLRATDGGRLAGERPSPASLRAPGRLHHPRCACALCKS